MAQSVQTTIKDIADRTLLDFLLKPCGWAIHTHTRMGPDHEQGHCPGHDNHVQLSGSHRGSHNESLFGTPVTTSHSAGATAGHSSGRRPHHLMCGTLQTTCTAHRHFANCEIKYLAFITKRQCRFRGTFSYNLQLRSTRSLHALSWMKWSRRRTPFICAGALLVDHLKLPFCSDIMIVDTLLYWAIGLNRHSATSEPLRSLPFI